MTKLEAFHSSSIKKIMLEISQSGERWRATCNQDAGLKIAIGFGWIRPFSGIAARTYSLTETGKKVLCAMCLGNTASG